MMNKLTKFAIAGAVTLVVGAASLTAFAASGFGPRGRMPGVDSRPFPSDRTAVLSSEELATLQAQCLERMQEVLDARVAAGTMTKEQEDQILAAIKERQAGVNESGYGAGYGRMGRAGYGAGYGCGINGTR